MVRVFVDCGVNKLVFRFKILVVQEDFPVVGFVQTVYFPARLAGKNNRKIRGAFFQPQKHFLYLILIHTMKLYTLRAFFYRRRGKIYVRMTNGRFFLSKPFILMVYFLLIRR